jgi:hypothetical protein
MALILLKEGLKQAAGGIYRLMRAWPFKIARSFGSVNNQLLTTAAIMHGIVGSPRHDFSDQPLDGLLR